MEITLKITNSGNLPGTVGWLAKQAHEIHLAPSKGGGRGAWLKNEKGEQVACLAYTEYGDVIRTSRGLSSYPGEASATTAWTDAAWAALVEIQGIAADKLAEDESRATVSLAVAVAA